MVFRSLNFINVTKHPSNFPLKSLLCPKHVSSSRYTTNIVLMFKVVPKEEFYPKYSLSLKVRSSLKAIANYSWKLFVVKVLIEFYLK